MKKTGFVYIMTNKGKSVLYIGVTNNLCRRIYEHKNHLKKNSFTDRYNVEHCIYFEEFSDFNLAIQREKELKKWNRQKKEDLINKKNPEWNVLVTEKGFVRKTVSFAQQVVDVLKECEQGNEIPPYSKSQNQVATNEIPPYSKSQNQVATNEIPSYSEGQNQVAANEIPPFGRNDNTPLGDKAEIAGGKAASNFSPFSTATSVISSEARKLTSLQTNDTEHEARKLTSLQTNDTEHEARKLTSEQANDTEHEAKKLNS